MFESSGTTHHSPQVTGFMQQLEHVDQGDYVELTALQAFLVTHGHGATLPEVRWRIKQSRHTQLMGELRTKDPFPPYRVLFAMAKDESWLVFLVAGNKGEGNHRGNGWYDAWVPVADAMLNQFLARR